jgi:hypothetical protein
MTNEDVYYLGKPRPVTVISAPPVVPTLLGVKLLIVRGIVMLVTEGSYKEYPKFYTKT